MQRKVIVPRLLTAFAFLVLMVAGCTTSPTGRSQFMLISPDTAIAESRVAYVSTVRQLERQHKLLEDPMLADRVSVVTGRLVAETVRRYPHTAGWRWSVALIDEPGTVNAWCMAGGRMALYSGLVHRLDLTDDELAQVMGHEISHAVANHTAERMSMALAQNLGARTVGAVTGHPGLLRGTALAAVLAIQLPNSRTAESEADRMGSEIAASAGYEPLAALTLWQKMQRHGGSRRPEFLSTHPSPGNRQLTLASHIPEMRRLSPAAPPKPYPVQIIP